MNSAPFVTVALAGHVNVSGAYCDCGSSPDCICGPGEMRTNSQPASDQPASDVAAPSGVEAANDFDPGAGVMLLTLALLLGLRLRL